MRICSQTAPMVMKFLAVLVALAAAEEGYAQDVKDVSASSTSNFEPRECCYAAPPTTVGARMNSFARLLALDAAAACPAPAWPRPSADPTLPVLSLF